MAKVREESVFVYVVARDFGFAPNHVGMLQTQNPVEGCEWGLGFRNCREQTRKARALCFWDASHGRAQF